MGAGPSVPKNTPLAEMISNWGRLSGTAGLHIKRLIALCQDDWPFISRVAGASLDDRWLIYGSFEETKLQSLRKILEDCQPQQMNYLYLWFDYADIRKRKQLQKSMNKHQLLAYLDDEISDNSKPKTDSPAGIFPMTLSYVANPRAGRSNAGNQPLLLMVTTHHPWKPGDLLLWHDKMPRLRDDAERCSKIIRTIARDYSPSWNDMQTLLSELFTHEEKQKILAKDKELAEQTQGRNPWPDQDPNWNLHEEDQKATYLVAIDNLIEAIRKCDEKVTNWSKVAECQQAPDEHPGDFWHHLRKALIQYGGMTEDNFQEPLAISIFVNQSAPDIRKHFQKHMPGWQVENLQKVLSVANFVYNGCTEEQQHKLQLEREAERLRQEKEREVERRRYRRERQEDMNLLAVAIAQGVSATRGRGYPRGVRGVFRARFPRGRGVLGRGIGMGSSFPPMGGSFPVTNPAVTNPTNDAMQLTCFWCGNLGHMQRECPLQPQYQPGATLPAPAAAVGSQLGGITDAPSAPPPPYRRSYSQ